ncbi:MAG: APC family permease [Lacisediminihabitans sp.]
MHLEEQNTQPVVESTSEEERLQALGYKQELKRSMSLTDVVVYGLIFMVPLAPVGVFGAIFNYSHGMPALVYLVAGIAMIFSALSYKEMAKKYPVAGSVYSYVRLGTTKFIGFLAGWAILLDYLLLPALLSILGASAMAVLLPQVPGWVWVVVFVGAVAAINLRGIVLTARMNMIFMVIQLAAFAVFVGGALFAIAQGRASFSITPFFQPEHISLALVFGAIPLAALAYIGFDAISTLNEEARGGGKAVSKATMIVLVLVVVLFVAQVYFAALFVPTTEPFKAGDATNNAFYDIAGVVVAPWFKVVFTLISALIALFANVLVSHATTSKMVFAMARDGQLPRVLAHLNPKRRVPTAAMVVVAIVSVILGVVAVGQIEILTTMVTFGALTAYILLHISIIVDFGIRGSSKHIFIHWISPIIGIVVLGYALWSTNVLAKIVGLSWIVVGILIALLLRRFGRTLETDEI